MWSRLISDVYTPKGKTAESQASRQRVQHLPRGERKMGAGPESNWIAARVLRESCGGKRDGVGLGLECRWFWVLGGFLPRASVADGQNVQLKATVAQHPATLGATDPSQGREPTHQGLRKELSQLFQLPELVEVLGVPDT